MTRCEHLGRPRVDNDRALRLTHEHAIEIDVRGIAVIVEQFALSSVRIGCEREVERRHRLALSDGFDELVLTHGCKRVVRTPLLADRGLVSGREVLATGRARAMRGKHAGFIGEAQELVVDRVVEPAGKVVRGPADRGEQVGTADIPNEESVSRQHPPRFGIVGVLPDDDRDRLGRMAGSVSHFQGHVTQRQPLTVGEWLDREVRPRFITEGDDRTGRRRELQMARQEVGVEMRLEHTLDPEAQPRRVGNVLRHVALRVDHDGATGGLVADHVAEE